MSRNNSNLDLPALSADESGGSITDASTLEGTSTQGQKSFAPVTTAPFIDNNFFYNLDGLAPDNPLFFMPQQQQQSQQQTDQTALFGNQFLKEAAAAAAVAANSEDSNSTSLAQSIAASMASFQQAITSSVGEQPPSFWAGLNNFISNVTHNNLFPTFPNIARSFSEYIASHPVPFLSSFNAPTASPISSPMPSNTDYDALIQFKRECEQSNSGLQIRVLGVAQSGAKSRVETQIKLCIQLVTDRGDKAQWWSHLKLPEYMVTKDKLRKSANRGAAIDTGLPADPKKMLHLRARVLCASDPSKKVTTCMGCIQRERKRSQRRKESKQQQAEDIEDDKSIEEDNSLALDEERILLFNCAEVVDFSAGDTILPTRITCYCRHHNERLGFCIYFEMLDFNGNKVADGISPPIMITDDHKSNKLKSGSKRRRTTENDTPGSSQPDSTSTLDWIKSFQFSNPIKSEPNLQQYSLPSSSASNSNANGSSFKNMITPALPMLFTQPTQPPPQPPQQQQQTSPPLMKRLIPNEAPASGGIEITILGTDFRPGMTIMFGDSPATNVQYWSPNTLICTLPPAIQPGTVVVSFKEGMRTTNKSEVMLFTYLVETDRALMELALQVVGMKMTGIVEDARKIAMRIVQGNSANNNLENMTNVKKEDRS